MTGLLSSQSSMLKTYMPNLNKYNFGKFEPKMYSKILTMIVFG